MFTDFSSRALGQVATVHGRAVAASTTQPAQLRCRLRNTDGALTYLKRGTPLRYSINPGTGFGQWFQGEVAEVTPVWPSGNSTVAEVQIVAAGVLRRLTQGSPTAQSPIFRSTSVAPGLVAYAPLEDDSGSTGIYVRSRLPQNGLFGGAVTFAGETTMGGTKQAIILQSNSYLGLSAQGFNFTGQWTSDFFYKFTGSDPAAETTIMRCYAASGSVSFVDAVYGGGNWGIRVYDGSGTQLTSAIFAPPAGQATGWWHWRLMAHDAGGGNTDYQLINSPIVGTPISFGTATIAGSPGNLTGATVPPSANLNGVAMAHWALFDQWNFSAVFGAATGYTGENAVTRLKRLCSEEGIEITVTGSSSATMGPQKPASIMQLLRDCEAADGGLLYDGYTAGLSYLAEQSRYNRTPTLALDTKKSQIKLPFQPTKNDQFVVNDVTLANPAGDSAGYSDEDNVAVNGRYTNPGTGTVNLADTNQLLQLAAWQVHLGTADDLRIPQVQLELGDRPELWTSVLALRPAHTVTAGNLLDQFPPGTASVIAEGIQATVDATSWRVGINCSPGAPFNTGTLDANADDCGASVIASALASAPAGSSSTVDVAVSDACLWSVADGPVNLTLSGTELAAPEVVTLTAASGATTATPSLIAVGTAASSDGFSTRTITPGLPGGATAAGNLLLMYASCRDTNALDTGMYITGPPGWVKIYDAVNVAFFAKVHSGSETAPTLNIFPFGTIVGDTLVAEIASFSGKWGDPKSQLVGVSQQFNAAAQNIAYPALPMTLGGILLIWFGWKAAAWTSVATLGGVTEIDEPSSTAGNDAGIVWDWNNSAGVPSIGSGSFVVTGGTSQISRGGVLALRSVYQTLTITRGVNGIVRAHNIGEQVHVTDALTAARQ